MPQHSIDPSLNSLKLQIDFAKQLKPLNPITNSHTDKSPSDFRSITRANESTDSKNHW